MRKTIFTAAIAIFMTASAFLLTSSTRVLEKQEYLQVTTVESVVPAGLGRSRMITTDNQGNMQEIKLSNFYSAVGINFGNIRENDREITRKIGDLSDQGWELIQVTSGVESTETSTGIFITRYLFKRAKS